MLILWEYEEIWHQRKNAITPQEHKAGRSRWEWRGGRNHSTEGMAFKHCLEKRAGLGHKQVRMARRKWEGKAWSVCRRQGGCQVVWKCSPHPRAVRGGKGEGADIMGPGGVSLTSMETEKHLASGDPRNGTMPTVLGKGGLGGAAQKRKETVSEGYFSRQQKCRGVCSWARKYRKHGYELCVSKTATSR